MKKLHLLFALLLAWLSVGGVWADKEIVKISKIIPISESAVIAFQRNKGKFHPLPISGHVRLYAKGTMTITPKPGYTFTKIDYAFVINTGSYNYKPTPKLNSKEGSFTTTSTGGTWMGSTTSTVELLVYGSVGNLEISSVTITYTHASKQSSSVAFTAPSYSCKQGSDEATSFKGQTATTTPAGLALTYSSDNESVASVDGNTGAVTLKGAIGKATITASFAGNNTYSSSSASYTITVKPNITNDGTADKPYTVADIFALKEAGSLPTTEVYVKGTISKVDKFNSKDGELTYYISDDGTTAQDLQIYNGLGLNGAKFTGTADLATDWDVTVKGTLKVLKGSLEIDKASQITNLKKTTVESPVISGTTAFLDNTTVTLTTSDKGAKIYYTTDGTEPTDKSTEYKAPFTLNATTTVKAVSYLNGKKSNVASQTFKKVENNDLTSVAQALKATDNTQVYVKAEVTKTDTYDSSSSTLNYYIADSENAANSLEVLNGRYLQDADITNADQIVRGDEVIVKATVETTNKGAKVLKDVHLISIKEYQDQAKVSSAGWATFVSRRAVDFPKASGLSAYTVKYDATANQVTLSPVTAIPGNTAVVVKANAGTYDLQRGETSTTVENNDLTFSWVDKKVTAPFTIYVLAKQGDGCGFYPVKANETLAPFKGYLTINTASSSAAKPFYAIGGNTTTGINNAMVEAENKEGVRYNLAGQRVNNNYKGLVIVNGHKVIIK